jgi:hypothetical protein
METNRIRLPKWERTPTAETIIKIEATAGVKGFAKHSQKSLTTELNQIDRIAQVGTHTIAEVGTHTIAEVGTLTKR